MVVQRYLGRGDSRTLSFGQSPQRLVCDVKQEVPADHYRHSRLEYLRALERAHPVEPPAETVDDEDEKVAAVGAGDGPSV